MHRYRKSIYEEETRKLFRTGVFDCTAREQRKCFCGNVSHELTTLSITRTEDGKKKNKGEQKREQSDNVAFGAGMFVNGFGLQLIYRHKDQKKNITILVEGEMAMWLCPEFWDMNWKRCDSSQNDILLIRFSLS